MSENRTTKAITYNLAERGRKHNGIDRSDVNIRSIVEKINSPQVQELVQSGDLVGYYGHEIRQRFGMHPPDTWVNPQTGETVRLEPAFKTISLTADNNGNVTARHEFLDTDSGNYSMRLYKNKTGGFSSAIPRKRGSDGLYHATGFSGYDYVLQPNYDKNRGDGQLDKILFLDDEEMAFDSINNPQRFLLNQALDNAIAYQLDNIASNLHANQLINHFQKETINAQNALIQAEENYQKQKQLRQQRREQRERDIYDSMLCPTMPFEEVCQQWDNFIDMGTSDKDTKLHNTQPQITEDHISIFDRIRGTR